MLDEYEALLSRGVWHMSDAAWEDVSWKVTDPEHGIASFWCADFRIERL